MSTPAAPIRVRLYPYGPSADDPRARCLWHAVADWCDDQAGDSSEGPLWAGLLGRRVAIEDAYGFRSVSTFRNEDDARAFLASVADYVTPGWREDNGGTA